MFLQVLSLFKLHIWRNRKAKWSAIGHTVPAKEWSKPRHRSPHSKNKGMERRNSLRSFYQENPFSLFGWGPAYLLESVGEKLARCGGKRLAMGVGSRVSFEALGLGLAYCGSSAEALWSGEWWSCQVEWLLGQFLGHHLGYPSLVAWPCSASVFSSCFMQKPEWSS